MEKKISTESEAVVCSVDISETTAFFFLFVFMMLGFENFPFIRGYVAVSITAELISLYSRVWRW